MLYSLPILAKERPNSCSSLIRDTSASVILSVARGFGVGMTAIAGVSSCCFDADWRRDLSLALYFLSLRRLYSLASIPPICRKLCDALYHR